MEIDQRHHEQQQRLFPGPMPAQHPQESPQQKRHVVDKHDVPVYMKKASGSQKQASAQQGQLRPKPRLPQQKIEQNHAAQITGHRIGNDDIFHGNLGQETAKQHIRPQIPIISKIINVAPAAQGELSRKQRALRKNRLPHGVRNGHMLGQPVSGGAVETSGDPGEKDQQRRQNQQQRGIK